uniref:Uncharacterized LOC107583070 n=1 Tax=Sinocyclocheilus grahami TaxID=75366 RepID=A0A672SXR2_SINGR
MLPAPPPDVRATVYLTVPTKMELDNETATFMCLAQRFSPKSNTFKWSLDGKEVTKAIDKCDKSEKKGSVTEYSATSILQISAGDWKPNTKVKCEFVHKAGNEEREAEFKPTVFILAPPEHKPGEPMTLTCYVKDFYPKEVFVSWLADDEPVTSKYSTSLPIQTDQIFSVYSQLTVNDSKWKNGTVFSCVVYHEGIDEKMLIAPSSQRAEFYLVGPSLSSVRSDTSVYLTCLVVVQSVKLFSIQWKVNGIVPNPNGHEQEPRVHDNGTESKESILKVFVTDWNAYALFTCEVKHLCSDYTQEKRISKTRDPKQPTVRILRPSDSDLSGLQNACLLCLITGFFPSDISVQWQLNETQLDASQFTNSPVAAHTSGGFSMHSALMLPASEWKDGTFSCVVSHESSQNPITATIENLYGHSCYWNPVA